MDQSYRIHKWLGLGAMAAILLHDTIDAEMDGLGTETLIVEIAETLGEISLYGLLVLVAITVATFIPYHLWKWTHRLIGIFFVFGALHYLFILKPFKNGDPLGLYMAAVCAIGLVAYLYTSAPRRLRPSQKYRINALERSGTALAVEMSPTGKPIRHGAGQSGFFAFDGAGLREPHPFTISSAPRDDGFVRITIAPLGDLTCRLIDRLDVDQMVRVTGPFGCFGRGVSGPQVWVAAGIGVTPFVAMAEALEDSDGPVTMIHAVRSQDEAAHHALLTDLADHKPNFDVTLWQSSKRGRLTPENVVELMGPDISEAHVFFCGPVEMRRALVEKLQRSGLPRRRIHYEQFEIRTGIGLKRLLGWLWSRRSG
ncbi:MAG: ferredoxin reductase family protein, partial [Pseudomonadota bacterium]